MKLQSIQGDFIPSSYKNIYKQANQKTNENEGQPRNDNNLQKIKSLYESYENGRLNDKDFKSALQREINAGQSKADVSSFIKESNFDNISFRSIVSKTGLLKDENRRNLPEYSVDDMKKSTDYDYHKRLRYQKTFFFANRPNSSAPEENKVLNESVASFAKGKLDETSFRNILRSNNIDPDLYPIQKEIRATTVGAKNASKNLISNLIRYKNHKAIPVKELNIYDVKENIEQKRQTNKDYLSATGKRIYDFNPNYLSDKNIFEMNVSAEEQKSNNSFMAKPNREMFNTVNVVGENPVRATEQDKYQKKVYKMEQHHQQMSSQLPLGDPVYSPSITQRNQTQPSEKNRNFSTIQNPNPAKVIFRTAIEKTSNLGKRTCNEYKTIFEDVKYKVNYKKNTHRVKSDNCVLAKLEGEWARYVKIDGKEYWRQGEFELPDLEKMEFVLPSDTIFREDILLLKHGFDDLAQEAKTHLEEKQRHDRKLRENFQKMKNKK